MKSRSLLFAFGMLAAIACLALTTGGFPARPQFQSVGIGVTAPSTAGQLQTLSAIGIGLAPNAANQTVGVQAPASAYAAALLGAAGTGTSFGVNLLAGTNSSDTALLIRNQAGGSTFLKIDGAGNITAPNAGSVPWTAATINCTTACNVSGLVVGQSAYISKTATTSRSNTTTLTADPDLQFTNVPAGSYLVAFNIQFIATALTGGAQWRLDYAGSQFEPGVGVNDCNNTITTMTVNVNNAVPQTCTINGAGFNATVSYIRQAIPTGTMSIDWAQNSSNASPTGLNATSGFAITRMH